MNLTMAWLYSLMFIIILYLSIRKLSQEISCNTSYINIWITKFQEYSALSIIYDVYVFIKMIIFIFTIAFALIEITVPCVMSEWSWDSNARYDKNFSATFQNNSFRNRVTSSTVYYFCSNSRITTGYVKLSCTSSFGVVTYASHQTDRITPYHLSLIHISEPTRPY